LAGMAAWKAFIPSLKKFPKLAPLIGRVVLVKGPSRNFWLSNADIYYDDTECQITKLAHVMTNTAIKLDPNRQSCFYLIVFQKGIILDNFIFSGNNDILQMYTNGMKVGPEHRRYPVKKKKKMEVIGMSLWWRIGIARGTIIPDGKEEADAADFFD
jgi:hypothetical protein